MKKLTQLIEAVGSVDTSSYPNIKFAGSSSSDKINLPLLADINTAANASGIDVTIGTAVTGHREMTSSGNVSRHTTGEAVDISRINGSGWKSKTDAESKHILSNIESFVSNLRNMGYSVNNESGNSKAVLYFGFPDHNDHIHISYQIGGSPSDLNKETPGTSKGEEYATDYLVKAISKVAKPMFGLNESKQKRVLLNIEKIRKLL